MTIPPIGLDALIHLVRAQHPDGDALMHLRDAMLVSQQLSDQADHLIGHFVDQARRAGASWSAIGEAMGVTKQAAQKRFVPSLPGLDLPDDPPLSRFTPRARTALAVAAAEARRLEAAEVGPLHLLLGLLADPDGLAARAIVALGVSTDQVRAAAGESGAAGEAGEDSEAAGGSAAGGAPGQPVAGEPAGERLPFGRRARTVLVLTLQEALSFGHNYIGTEHMLLAVLDEGGDGAAVLEGLGVTEAGVRSWLVQAFAEILATRERGEGSKETGA